MIQDIKKIIPNAITSCNLISGCIATIFALQGNPNMALLWIVTGAVFDFFDGMSARLLGVSSPIGKELDSLADCITFGFAPAAILFNELHLTSCPDILKEFSSVIPYTAFIMAAFSALRLAKFNLDERQSMGFIGLPTPANALFWSAFIIGFADKLEATPYGMPVLLLMMAVSCSLLIAEIPMFALKFKHWGWTGNRLKYVFIIFCIPILAIYQITGIAIIIAWYIILSIWNNAMNAINKEKQDDTH